MNDNPTQDPQGHQDPQGQEATGSPLRVVRGDASPEELAALVAILAIHASATGEDGPVPADLSGSRWSTRRRVFHSTYPHGPGGWRASAFPN